MLLLSVFMFAGFALQVLRVIWARYGGIDEAAVLRDLPKSLRAAVANHVLGPLLRRIPFFAHCSHPMEQMLVSLFETRIFLQDDPLMICGEVGQDMFIIEKGEVEITSADRSKTYAKLSDGDYVGESCFLELSKRTASAYALDYVDTYFLTRDNFLKVHSSSLLTARELTFSLSLLVACILLCVGC
jgi:hypothetical protein